MLGIIFPGQGSQFRGMGKDLFSKYPDLLGEADEILGYSLKKLCLEDPDKHLSLTQYTQPALYVVNTFFYRDLMAKGEKPDALAGHSLGEYNALSAAGVFDFSTGLRLVKKRGEIMGKAKGGGMAAVLGLPSQEIKAIMDKHGITDIDFANFNSPLQTVISGPSQTIVKLEKYFSGDGVRYIPLNVSASFHSRYMADASEAFSQFVQSFTFNEPSVPVISNIFARYFHSQKEIKDNLATQINSAVRWCESMQYFIRSGGSRVIESGPGTVLSQLFEFIKKQSNKSDLEPVNSVTASGKAPGLLQNSHFSTEINTLKDTGFSSQIEHVNVAMSNHAPSQSEPTVVVEKATPSLSGAVFAEEKEIKSKNDVKEPAFDTYLAKRLNQIRIGSSEFCDDYSIRYPCIIGGMQSGISSAKMLIRLGKAGLLGFLGTYNLSLERITTELNTIKESLRSNEPFGMNIVHQYNQPERDRDLIELAIKHDVRVLELSNFLQISEELVRYRFSGATSQGNKDRFINKVIVKVDQYEVASLFMSPVPKAIVEKLRREQKLTIGEAEIAQRNPLCDDICLVGGAAWRSDGDASFSIWSSVKAKRDELTALHGYKRDIRIGLSGGFGSPQTISTAFFFGADFVVTGSINQCTVEAETSELAKDMLQASGVKDFGYAPFHDLFEMGERAQVLKRGVFFPHRANKLYQYYAQYDSPADIDPKVLEEIEGRYFRQSLGEIFSGNRGDVKDANAIGTKQQGKADLAFLFKSYLKKSLESALTGSPQEKVNFQIFSSPAMGAFNEYVKGSSLENWRNRHVDEITILLMRDSEQLLRDKIRHFLVGSGLLMASHMAKKDIEPVPS